MARPKLPGDDRRTSRVTLIMTPAEYEGLYILAQMQDRTINNLCCSILAQIVQKNAAVIEAFKADKKKHAADIDDELSIDISGITYRRDFNFSLFDGLTEGSASAAVSSTT